MGLVMAGPILLAGDSVGILLPATLLIGELMGTRPLLLIIGGLPRIFCVIMRPLVDIMPLGPMLGLTWT